MRMLIENESIQLVRTEREDISFVTAAEGEQENARFICQWSTQQHVNALDDEDTLHLMVKNIAGDNVGYVIIRGMTNPNNSIELMRIVITEKCFGYGKEVISLIKKWCFEELKAHRLWLDVQEDNRRAQHVYKTLGFQCEGILRECMKAGGAYKSLVAMAILAGEYQEGN